MTSRNDKRIRRIEHKCDRIISELASLRRCLYSRSNDIDVTIERMHNNARELRKESEYATRFLNKLLHSKNRPFAIKVDGVCKADDCKERFFAIGGGMWRGDGVGFLEIFCPGRENSGWKMWRCSKIIANFVV